MRGKEFGKISVGRLSRYSVAQELLEIGPDRSSHIEHCFICGHGHYPCGGELFPA